MNALRRVLLLVAACAAAPAAFAVDVNTATQAELEALPGLGVETTERLLAERERGPFADWADLTRRVKGLKAATAAKLSAAGLTVAGASYAADKPGAGAASRR